MNKGNVVPIKTNDLRTEGYSSVVGDILENSTFSGKGSIALDNERKLDIWLGLGQGEFHIFGRVKHR